jgi:bifunctional non-homologous end joining protein LigD
VGNQETFFQRHLGAGFGDSWLHAATAQDAAKTGDYIYFRKPDALVIAVQMNVLEFHIWGSRVDKVDLPDRIVFDLDPDPTVDFAKVRQAAIRLRDVLEALDLASLPMLTGGKGIHVIVPIRRHYEWPIIKAFAANLANRLVADAPDRYIATMSKAQRKHKIFIDHFRNERGATAIAPYSPRARPGAPVAWPLDWSELDDTSASNAITIREAVAAIAGGKSGWARYPEYARQALKVAALKTLDVNI